MTPHRPHRLDIQLLTTRRRPNMLIALQRLQPPVPTRARHGTRPASQGAEHAGETQGEGGEVDVDEAEGCAEEEGAL